MIYSDLQYLQISQAVGNVFCYRRRLRGVNIDYLWVTIITNEIIGGIAEHISNHNTPLTWLDTILPFT